MVKEADRAGRGPVVHPGAWISNHELSASPLHACFLQLFCNVISVVSNQWIWSLFQQWPREIAVLPKIM